MKLIITTIAAVVLVWCGLLIEKARPEDFINLFGKEISAIIITLNRLGLGFLVGLVVYKLLKPINDQTVVQRARLYTAYISLGSAMYFITQPGPTGKSLQVTSALWDPNVLIKVFIVIPVFFLFFLITLSLKSLITNPASTNHPSSKKIPIKSDEVDKEETKIRNKNVLDQSDLIFYEKAQKEWDTGKTHKGLLAKTKALSDGNKDKQEAIYLKWRAEMLLKNEGDEPVAKLGVQKTEAGPSTSPKKKATGRKKPAMKKVAKRKEPTKKKAAKRKEPAKKKTTQKNTSGQRVIKVQDITLHGAVIEGKIEVVKQLLKTRTNINPKGKHYEGTLLHIAAAYNHKEIVKLLINKGADVNARDNTGETPLDWSGSGCYLLLRERGGRTAEELKRLE